MQIYLTEKIHAHAVAFLESNTGLESSGRLVQGGSTVEKDIISQAQGCQAILVRSAYVTKDVMRNIPTLKVVAKHGIGVDNIDVEAATELGIQVLNAPFSNLDAVAEHTMALMMGLSKNMIQLDQATKAGDFAQRNQFVNLELSGKTLGLMGFGRIARKLAHKVSGLDMKIITSDPYVNKEEAADLGVQLVSLEELLASSDFLSLHIPLSDSTHQLMAAKTFGQMKASAYLINASRGGVVNEADLVEALQSGRIAGAALDVFDPEPPSPTNPLLSLKNVIVSPHNAAITDRALLAMAMDSATGIVDFLQGRTTLYPVNSLAVNKAE